MKNAESMSICNDSESSGKGDEPATKDSACPEMISVIEKSSPHNEPVMAKTLLQMFARTLAFLNNKEPIAPMKKSESTTKKPIGELILPNILL